MTTLTAPAFSFPHPELTPIRGRPTNPTISLLRKEVYANCRAVPSLYGGGEHGHLGTIMPAAPYIALTGHAFTLPNAPGPAPVHLAGATNFEINETIRLYNVAVVDIRTAHSVRAAIKAQILKAVENTYLTVLQDATFGFSDVTPTTMLEHLYTTYGTLTHDDLEANRKKLSEPWNVDNPIEDLWAAVEEIKRIAAGAQEPLSEAVCMGMLFTMLEGLGVLTWACDTWSRKPAADKTWANFQAHFSAEDKERLRKLTSGLAGFHGANAATDATPPVDLHTAFAATTTPATPRRTPTAVPPTPAAGVLTNDGTRAYYCWTHGLGTNANHTSATCQRPGDGHKQNATFGNMQGGNNTIMTGRPRRPNASAPAAAN